MKGVIIDGLGRSGKTELIGALKARLKMFGGCDVRELDHVECDDQFVRYLQEYATDRRWVLFHRSHVSECVFGTLQRGRSPFSSDEVAILNGVLTLRFVCVLAEPPDFDSFLQRANSRGFQGALSEGEYAGMIAAFRQAFSTIPHDLYVSRSREDLLVTRDRILSLLGIQGPTPDA